MECNILPVLGTLVEKSAVLTVRTAARISGANDRSIRRYFERQGIGQDALDSGLRNHRVTVDADQISGVLKKLKGAWTTPQVIEHTGIPRIHLNALLAMGVMPTVTGSAGEAHAKHRFAPTEVDATMDKLFAGAVDVHKPLPRQMPVLEARQAACASLEQIFTWILDGSLTWKGRLAGRSDYGALLLDADEGKMQLGPEHRYSLEQVDQVFEPSQATINAVYGAQPSLTKDDGDFLARAFASMSRSVALAGTDVPKFTAAVADTVILEDRTTDYRLMKLLEAPPNTTEIARADVPRALVKLGLKDWGCYLLSAGSDGKFFSSSEKEPILMLAWPAVGRQDIDVSTMFGVSMLYQEGKLRHLIFEEYVPAAEIVTKSTCPVALKKGTTTTSPTQPTPPAEL